jgi:CSLREA domain-containing protein
MTLQWKNLAITAICWSVAAGLIFSFAAAAEAATFTVTKTNDTADGTCNADCSLREAVIAANALAGEDTINLPSDTLNLTIPGRAEAAAATGDLDITDDVIITGDSFSTPNIDANQIDRIFDITAGVNVELSNLVLKNGLAHQAVSGFGGAILNLGNLSITNCTFSNNTGAETTGSAAASGYGGAIYSAAPGVVVLIDSSQFTSNIAVKNTGSGASHGFGGALYVSEVGTIENSAFTMNTAVQNSGTGDGSGYGGALFHSADALGSIDNSTFSSNVGVESTGNTPSGFGGALYLGSAAGVASITDSEFTNNRATIHNGSGSGSGYGGGVFTTSAITTFTDSTISGNTAKSGSGAGSGFGGGIYYSSTIATFSRLNIDSNVALEYDGSTSSSGFGGGIFSSASSATLANSAVTNNVAKQGMHDGSAFGGGIYASSALSLQNVTVSGNTGYNFTGSGVAAAYGGGIFQAGGDPTTYEQATIASNTGIVDGGSGTVSAFGGGFYNSGALTITNTIIGDNVDGNASPSSPDCFLTGGITSGGYNIIGDTTGCAVTPTTGDQFDVDPQLAALADNGGSNGMTHDLPDSSPALDAIPAGDCPLATDQREMDRPQGGTCDIGALEVDQTAPVVTIIGSNPLEVKIGDDFADPGATATDNFDGTITAAVMISEVRDGQTITTSGTVDTNHTGTYVITYTATDDEGNQGTATRDVEVVGRGGVTKLTELDNGRVRVTYADGSKQTFTIFPQSTGVPICRLSTNDKRIICVNRLGKKVKVVRAATGGKKDSRKINEFNQDVIRLKVFNFYGDKRDEIIVATRNGGNLKTSSVSLTRKKSNLKNLNSELFTPFTFLKYKIRREGLNVQIRHAGEVVVEYPIGPKGELNP